MNACISESGCTCSVSLLVVKLWDLVIKKYMLELFSFKQFYPEITQLISVLNDCVRLMYYTCDVCALQCIRLEPD